MQRHINLVAYLHIGYGVLLIIAALIVFVFVTGGGLLSGDAGAFAITATVAGIVGTILIILAIPAFAAGYGLLQRKEWSRVLVIILSVIYLFSFPVGTALGIYSIWAMMQDETVTLLSRR